MSSLELEREGTRSGLLRHIRWLHRLFGYMDQPMAIWSAQQLLAHLGNGQVSPEKMSTCLGLAAGLLRQALVLRPFDAGLVKLVNQVNPLSPSSMEYRRWFSLVQRLHEAHPDVGVHEARAEPSQAGDSPDALFLSLQKESNPLVLLLGILPLWQRGEWKPVQVLGERLLAMPIGILAGPLLAWAAWGAGECELAQRWVALPGTDTFLSLNLQAEMALANGDRAQAMASWRKSLELEPVQPALSHRLWEMEQAGPLISAAAERKRVHVGFYTFNKLETTLRTLESLIRSDLGNARITLLNNGSTAFSHRDMENAVYAVAQGRAVQLIHLPVNIGAPAARNWLWHLPEMKQADYVAFLDDDVLLPHDWLDCYLEDLARFPDAVAVGPKVLNPGSLPTVQYAYRYFQEVASQKIRFTPAAPLSIDLGQYSYRRPCLSVMGCCHLFDRRRWEALRLPDFDVRFSPSQVDDLEHDLQIWKQGGQVLYDGRVSVVHLQDAGRQAPQSPASWAHVWGNHLKMESKFSGEELHEIDRRVNDADERLFSEVQEAAGSGAKQTRYWTSSDLTRSDAAVCRMRKGHNLDEELGFRVVMWSPAGYTHSAAFLEIAETVHHGIERAGCRSELVFNSFDPQKVNILFGAHLLPSDQIPLIPPGSILYNLEQISPDSPWLHTALPALIRRFETWDYSRKNIDILRAMGFVQRFRHVPIGHVPELARIQSVPEPDIDVLFYGSINERRRFVLDGLKDRGLRVVELFNVYGAERDAHIARTKLVINLHFCSAKIFEIVRVSYLLSNGKAVVSEYGGALDSYGGLSECVCLSPYERLVDSCCDLVRDDNARRTLERNGRAWMAARPEEAFLAPELRRLASLRPAQNRSVTPVCGESLSKTPLWAVSNERSGV